MNTEYFESPRYMVRWSELYEAWAIYLSPGTMSHELIHGYDHIEKSVVEKECARLNEEFKNCALMPNASI